MMPDAAGRLNHKIGSRRTVIVSAASLLLAVAVLVGGASAAPREGHEQPGAAMVALDGPRIAVVLPVRRAAIADPDMDGIVSHAEAERYHQARFALMDRNRDGRVSRDEFLRPAAAQSRHARGKAPAPSGHDAIVTGGNGTLDAKQFLGTTGWRHAWLEAAIDESPAAAFDLLDIDRNGALNRQEITNAGAEDFAASDANLDGQVTLREFYAGKRL